MGKLQNTLSIPATFMSLLHGVRRQRRFLKATLQPNLNDYLKSNPDALSTDDLKKIYSYYALGVPAILGTSYAMLRGFPLSHSERLAATYAGALTGIGDDFFDNENYSDVQLLALYEALINNSSEYSPPTAREVLFIKLFGVVLDNTKNPKLVKESVRGVFEAQMLSRKQRNINITAQELIHITRQKGGCSLLFYRSLLDTEATQSEKEMLFALGDLMQLGNDIFDVYRDSRQQIATLATTCIDIEQLRTEFRSKMNDAFNQIHKTHFSFSSMMRFRRFISMGMCRVFVALDMLEKLQKRSNNKFNPMLHSRKELICDMEKPSNLLRSIWYYIKT